MGSNDAITNIINTVRPDGQACLAEPGRRALIGRAARRSGISGVTAFLASDKASHIVGAAAMTDDGTSAVIAQRDPLSIVKGV